MLNADTLQNEINEKSLRNGTQAPERAEETLLSCSALKSCSFLVSMYLLFTAFGFFEEQLRKESLKG